MAVVMSALCACPVLAADWKSTGDLSLSSRAERNPALRADQSDTLLALSLEGRASLARNTETTSLIVRPSASLLRNPGHSDLDRDQQALQAEYEANGERSSLALSGAAARESTLTTELGTTGRTDVNRIRQSLSLSLSPSWRLTERVQAGASAGYQNSQYPGARAVGLYGSRYSTVSANLQYGITDRLNASLIGSAGRFDSDRFGGSSDNQLSLIHI